jgi:hypothetical protein
MEKKSRYSCVDGRNYDVTMTWNENFKDTDKLFKIGFTAVDQSTSSALKLPREIATYTIADPDEDMGERAKWYYGGSRELLMQDYLTSAYRRACDYIERGQ